MTDSLDSLHRIISHHIGEIRSISPLGAGLDNIAVIVNDELVVRQSIDPEAESRANAIRREVELLAVVGHHSPLPVPEIALSDPENGILAYRLLPGRPCIDLKDAHWKFDPTQLGEFLTRIHGIPLHDVETLVEHDDDPLVDWLSESTEAYAQIAGSIPGSFRPRIEAFLAEPPPPGPGNLVFCHNDFGAEHILVDPATMHISGIIDWTDAAITDLALTLRDFGPDALDRVLLGYGPDLTPEDHQRLVFHARCKLIEDLAYGIETGASRYVDAAMAHLDWTFG
jgi:aminoglycoside phosphotransferase (APT) family kinase protein